MVYFSFAHLFADVFFITGPGNWSGVCQTGKQQSPIDIKSTDATYDKNLGPFTLTNYDNEPSGTTFTVKNNGHALVVEFPEKVYNVSGGGLNDVYTTVQFHLHWASENTKGSEHLLDGGQFAAEVSDEGQLKQTRSQAFSLLRGTRA